MDRLEGLIEQKNTALEAIKAAGNVSAAFAYGILEEARRHLDVMVSREAGYKASHNLGQIKTVGQLFTRANVRWGVYRAEVLEALGVTDVNEIKDLDAAWTTVLDKLDKKYGGVKR
jgi:hypothetical protein